MRTVKPLLFSLLMISLIGFLPSISHSTYVYVSEHETDEDDNIVWFNPGYYYGQIHSNDFFNFKRQDILHIEGEIFTAQDNFHFDEGFNIDDLNLAEEPKFGENRVSIPYPENLRRNARPFISDNRGRYMTRVWLRGQQGILMYQYYKGDREPPLYGDLGDVFNVQQLGAPCWGAIFIDGDVEVYGVMYGNVTIGCSGDMYLIDDVRYADTRHDNGHWNNEDPDYTGGMNLLGLVSEQNIIISDNSYNGRNNSSDGHSIIINACLIALGGSLKIEHSNADWEPYQGPSPDHRGWIHLTGCIIQMYASALYNENHDGTGYYVEFRQDARITPQNPLFLELFYSSYLTGNRGNVYLWGDAYIGGNTSCDTLRIRPGTIVHINSDADVTVRRTIIAEGTCEEPIVFEMDSTRINLRVGDGHSSISLKHLFAGPDLNLQIMNDAVAIDSCEIAGVVDIQAADVEIRNSKINGETHIYNCWNGVVNIHRNVIEGGLDFDCVNGECAVVNNTILNSGNPGLMFNRVIRGNVSVLNNIITECSNGIVCSRPMAAVLRYNNVYGITGESYTGCEPGRGSISEDPLFVDPENGDYHLRRGSPCIDAGDPDSPRDPDGSRVEMGAYYFDRGLEVIGETNQPEEYSVSVCPNPFNANVRVSIGGISGQTVDYEVIDLLGRRIFTGVEATDGSELSLEISAARLGSPGVYFVKIDEGGKSHFVKLVYLP